MRGCGWKVSICLPRYQVIFLFLAVSACIFVLHQIDFLEVFNKNGVYWQKGITNYTMDEQLVTSDPVLRVSTEPDMNHSFCTLMPLSPKDALEERFLLDTIAWPETPVLPEPLPLEQTSDPASSTFTILPGRAGGQWHVGDQLEVMIKISDFKGRPKKSGGDYLVARLHNPRLSAGVAGKVVDHRNGSYSAVFSLLWEGSAQIEVILIHPSEAITVLQRLNREQPDRFSFQSVFRSGSISETTDCNICLRPSKEPVCNYTDPHTGAPWFCYKPKNLSCDTRIIHSKKYFHPNLRAKEEMLFQSGINMKVSIQASGPANVTVLPKDKGQPKVDSSNVPGPSGYYYQGVWRALGGTTVRQFDTSSVIRECLKDKMIHLLGDSTARQWLTYLTEKVPDLRNVKMISDLSVGPFMYVDLAKHSFITYRSHGAPTRFINTPTAEMRYVANEIDGFVGSKNTVVIISVWAHFPSFPIQLYIHRLQNIRNAVVRLLNRAPGMLVIIRTPTLREMSVFYALTSSEWYSMRQDKVLRAIFKGVNVHLVDAWDMVLAHDLPHRLHPQPPIIKNMVNVVLSYICPAKGG